MDLLDLPTHLPNSEQVVSEDATDPPSQTQQQQQSAVEKSEEEASNSKETIYIPGTTISLQTEEDIQKWIEERRKRWPTKSNIEKKQQEKKRSLPETANNNPPNKKSKQICKFFQQNKSCRFGNSCKNLHELAYDYTVINGVKTRLPSNFENSSLVKENASEKSSLYKMLVKKNQLELENSKFIKFLDYLDASGLIEHDYPPQN